MMTPTIRIDEEVMTALKKRAKELDLVFEPPNTTLRVVLGIDSKPAVLGDFPSNNTQETNKQTTIVIHAPWNNEGGKTGEPYSVETYLHTGIAKNYAIAQNEVNALHAGDKVIVLRNNKNKARVEGMLVELIKREKKTKNFIQKYDVVFKDQVLVDYSYQLPQEKLTLRGIKVYES
jgi:hypothetical protein